MSVTSTYLELTEYDLKTGPGQLNNVADLPEYAKCKRKLVAFFERKFTATYDPSALGIPPWKVEIEFPII